MNLTKCKKTDVKQFLKEMKANRTNQSSNKPSLISQQKKSRSIHSQSQGSSYDRNLHSLSYNEESRFLKPQVSKNSQVQQNLHHTQYQSQSQFRNRGDYDGYNSYSPVAYHNYGENRKNEISNFQQRKSQVSQNIYQNSNSFPLRRNQIMHRSFQQQNYQDNSYVNNYGHQHTPLECSSNFIPNQQSYFVKTSQQIGLNHINYSTTEQTPMQISMQIPQQQRSHFNFNSYSQLPKNSQLKIQNSNNRNSQIVDKRNSNLIRLNQSQRPQYKKQNNLNQEQLFYLNHISNVSQLVNMDPISQISDGCQGSQILGNNDNSQKVQIAAIKVNQLKQKSFKNVHNVHQNKDGQNQSRRPKYQNIAEKDVSNFKIIQKTNKRQFSLVSKNYQINFTPERSTINKTFIQSCKAKTKKGKRESFRSIEQNFKEGIEKISFVMPTIKNFVEACKQQLFWIEQQRAEFQKKKSSNKLIKG